MQTDAIPWVLGAFGVLGALIWLGASLARGKQADPDPEDGPVYPGIGFGIKGNHTNADPDDV